MAGVACADVQRDVNVLQVKVQQAQEAVKKEIVVAKQDQKIPAMQEKAEAKEFGLAAASKNLDHLTIGLNKVLAAARHKEQNQLKSMLKDEIGWLEQITTNYDQYIDRKSKEAPESINYAEGMAFVNYYLKGLLAELKQIAQ